MSIAKIQFLKIPISKLNFLISGIPISIFIYSIIIFVIIIIVVVYLFI